MLFRSIGQGFEKWAKSSAAEANKPADSTRQNAQTERNAKAKEQNIKGVTSNPMGDTWVGGVN